MANTVIALKKSATPTAAPADLANGELAINYADGKLYYKNVTGHIVSISSGSNSFGTVNANNTLVVSDTSGDILTLEPGTNISIVGDAINDKVTISLQNDVVIPSTGTFKVAAVGGDEGGEIKLANAITNSILTGDIVIDVYQNRLRFYESAGTNRGAFINLASAATGVGTDLLAGASATDTVARNAAGAAFDKANTANITADLAYNHANSAFEKANSALANSTGTFAGSLTITDDLIVRGNATLGDASTDTITLNGNSITLGNNQSVDSGTLFVDATNNRVGIGITNPTSPLHLIHSGTNTIFFIDGANSSISASPAFLVRVPSTGAQKAFQLSKGTDSFSWASFEYNIGGTGKPGFALGAGGASDRDVAIYRASANALTFSTGDIQRLTINISNVGIGITTPTSLLHVNGTANIVSSLIVSDMNVVPTIQIAYGHANLAYDQANTARTHANAAFLSSNSVNTYSDATYVKLTSASQTITGDVSIVGNLTLSGNTLLQNVTTLTIGDPLIYLAANNYVSDTVDIGFIGNYVNATGSNVHTGLYREHEDKMYYLFQGYDVEPINNHIGALSNNMTLAVLNADVRTSNLLLAGTNTVIWIRSAYDQANTSRTHANASFLNSNSAYDQANTGRTHANAAFLNSNSAFDQANTARTHANAAFDKANTAGGTLTVASDIVDTSRYLMFANGTSGTLPTANVTVGLTFNPSSNTLNINGALNAVTKSFVIPHPVNDEMMLRYGSLEGPENGVYVRGKLEGKSIIELPDYWWNLIDESTITVNITPIGRSQDIWVQSTSAYFIHLNQPADCFFTVFAERKDVDKLVVEY